MMRCISELERQGPIRKDLVSKSTMQVMKCAAITTTEEVHPVIGENAIWKIDTCGVQNKRMPRKALTFAVTENSTCRQGVVILKWGYLIPLARTEITQSREKAHKVSAQGAYTKSRRNFVVCILDDHHQTGLFHLKLWDRKATCSSDFIVRLVRHRHILPSNSIIMYQGTSWIPTRVIDNTHHKKMKGGPAKWTALSTLLTFPKALIMKVM
mmetsp:Transcript_2674/g.3805  ORF Transcript_2674/g.3805 Transcript_2674/m.3805 type:complete len:211 (-) Transcript_2674:88-720(-)